MLTDILTIIKVLYDESIQKICNRFDSKILEIISKKFWSLNSKFDSKAKWFDSFISKMFQFDWFGSPFFIRKIREKLIRNSFDSIRLHPYFMFNQFAVEKELLFAIFAFKVLFSFMNFLMFFQFPWCEKTIFANIAWKWFFPRIMYLLMRF